MDHVLLLGWARSGEVIQQNVTVSVEGEDNRDVTVPAATTHMEVDLDLLVANLQDLYLSSDVTLTLKTNSTSSPDNTITLTAGKPLVWYTGCGMANPFTVNVTKIYLTNATSGAATVKLRFGVDATP